MKRLLPGRGVTEDTQAVIRTVVVFLICCAVEDVQHNEDHRDEKQVIERDMSCGSIRY